MTGSGNKSRIVSVVILTVTITIATNGLYNFGLALGQQNYGEPEIPQAICLYSDQKYYLTPHIYNDGEKSSTIDFPDLPDDHMPQMIVRAGDELTMEFDGKKPVNVEALLVDYDADTTETYPLEKIDENTFRATDAGIRTLEVIATFPDNEHVSYTTLVDVEDEA
jgi:hypothetical protein